MSDALLASCPMCHGTNQVPSTYHEHDDPLPTVTHLMACTHCAWVRKWFVEGRVLRACFVCGHVNHGDRRCAECGCMKG